MDQNNGFPPQQPPQPGIQYVYVQPEIADTKGKAVAAMVLGICSTALASLNILALVAAIIGLVLAIGARKAIPVGYRWRGMATAGFVLSIIGIFLSVFMCLYLVVFVTLFSTIMQRVVTSETFPSLASVILT